MAVTADKVIVEFEAKLAKYNTDLRSSTALFQKSIDSQSRSIKKLETDIRNSSGQISSQLKGLAGALAGAFSAQQITGLIDNFTRLQNSLRVSGLEGQKLASVQSSLLALSSRYGVSVNELANLYGKSSQAAADLGASQDQLLKITEASAQALKITGTSAAQAQGALLGLTQALAGGIVRAEEFNQINEGGLRPLLQVAANAEKYSGSVAKLRQAVVDGKVSSQEFYTAILAGSAQLDAQASKATLTLAGAFEALTSQLTVYIGEASAANGVTGALAGAIKALADNLDVIIPALAIIAVAIGGRLAAAALVGGNSLRALSAYAGIATTSLAGTALAARGAGAALLGAFGGPVGLAITGVVLALGFAVSETQKLENITRNLDQAMSDAQSRHEQYSAAAQKAGIATNASANAAASATGKMGFLASALNIAANEYAKLAGKAKLAAIQVAQANIAIAKSDKSKAQGKLGAALLVPQARFLPGFDQEANRAIVLKSDALIAQEQANIALLQKLSNSSVEGVSAPKKVLGGGGGKSVKGSGGGGGDSGPSAAEVTARFNNELISLTQQTLSAQQSLAKSAEEKAELELRSIELARINAIDGIEAEKEYSATQKQRLKQQVERLAEEEQARVEQQRITQNNQNSADLAAEINRGLVDELSYMAENARTLEDRRDILKAIAQAEFNYKAAQIEQALLQEGISDAKRSELEAALANAQAESDRRKRDADKQALGPAAQYLDQLKNLDPKRQAEEFGVDALKDLNSELADAIVYGGDLGDVLEDSGKRFLAQLLEMTIQLLVIKPLLESIGNSFGGGGGLLSSIGGLFRASGGPVTKGQPYVVGEAGRELFVPSTSGTIVPNGRLSASGSKGGTSIIQLQLSGDIDARMISVAQDVSIQVTKASAPSIIDASVSETFRRSGRPRM
ncbi:MAG: tape measure protein [Shewanella sp.]